jgi:hypothetical protein
LIPLHSLDFELNIYTVFDYISASSLEISLMLETEHFMLRAEGVSEDLGMAQAWDHTELSHQESVNPI